MSPSVQILQDILGIPHILYLLLEYSLYVGGPERKEVALEIGIDLFHRLYDPSIFLMAVITFSSSCCFISSR